MKSALLRATVLAVAAPIMLVAGLSAAEAQTTTAAYNPSYTLFADQDVRSIVLAGNYTNPDGTPGSYLVNSFSSTAPVSTIIDPFPENAFPLYTFLLGASNFAASDGTSISAPADHLIVAFNDSFAANAIGGDDFSSLFPGFDERSIIAAADRLAGIGEGSTSDAVSYLFSFSTAVHNAGADFTLGSNFTLVSFSSGNLFGTGTSAAIPAAVTGPVPEPATWAMMVLGFGLAGIGLRRRAKVTTRVAFA